jgi:hypothetical protein
LQIGEDPRERNEAVLREDGSGPGNEGLAGAVKAVRVRAEKGSDVRMTVPSVVVRLEPKEVLELRRVTLDEDAEGALRFATEVLSPKVEEVLGRGHCRPTFEWGGQDLTPSGPTG